MYCYPDRAVKFEIKALRDLSRCTSKGVVGASTAQLGPPHRQSGGELVRMQQVGKQCAASPDQQTATRGLRRMRMFIARCGYIGSQPERVYWHDPGTTRSNRGSRTSEPNSVGKEG